MLRDNLWYKKQYEYQELIENSPIVIVIPNLIGNLNISALRFPHTRE